MRRFALLAVLLISLQFAPSEIRYEYATLTVALNAKIAVVLTPDSSEMKTVNELLADKPDGFTALNVMGNRGWELVTETIFPGSGEIVYSYTFKRPK